MNERALIFDKGKNMINAKIVHRFQRCHFGYGHAKKELLDLILTRFEKEREVFNYYMNNLEELEAKLQQGAEKTRPIALETLKRVRTSLGF